MENLAKANEAATKLELHFARGKWARTGARRPGKMDEIGAQHSRNPRAAARSLGLQLTAATPFCTIKHSITRYRITLEAFRAHLGGTSYTSPKLNGVWLSLKQLAKLPFTAAHKRILSQLHTPTERRSAKLRH